MKNSLLAAIALLLTGFTFGAHVVTGRAQTTARREELRQPDNWVAFSADQTVYFLDKPSQSGRYYRNTEGSERWEITEATERKSIIEISNVAISTFYTFSPGRGWTSRPTDVNVSNKKPVRWSWPMSGLAPYRYKLDISKAGSGAIQASTGFSAYIYTTSGGDVRLMVPELNFFPVVQQVLGRHTRVYSRVSLGEPLAELFVPPPDASITALQTPRLFKSRQPQ